MDDLHLHLLGAQLVEGVAQDLDGPLDIRLDDEGQLLHGARGKLLVQLFQGQTRALGQRRIAQLGEAVERNLPRLQSVFNHLKTVAGLRNVLQTQHFDRSGGRGLFQSSPAIIKHGAHLAVDSADDKRVAHAQRAVLNQDRRHRTAAAVEPAFDHRARSQPVRIGLQPLQVGHQQDHFQQQIQILALLGRDFHHHGVSAPVFRH